ncbi:MAG: ArsA-related P-loop ATPase [Microthrixaceae bacterium]
MKPADFFGESGLIIVAGKGGVGKTAVTSAMAVAASLEGLRTLVVEIEGKDAMASMFDTGSLDYAELELVRTAEAHAGVRARTLTPDDALLDYLADRGLKRISNRLVSSGLLDIIATAVPGIRDILVLGKVKQIERAGGQDLIILDAPAAGHAISFLRSASGLADAVRAGPINTQAHDVLELLADPARCRVVLVTLPEETPVNELIETAYSLEDDVGVALGPVVVNGVLPELPGLAVDPEEAARAADTHLLEGEADLLRRSSEFRSARRSIQDTQLERMAEELPLPQIHLPHLFTSTLGRNELESLAGSVLDGISALEAGGGA